jgi:transcriptional regulator with XRE-family HTH domain
MSSVSDTPTRLAITAVADLAAIIRDTRQRRGLTQLQLATAVGVTRQSVVNLETGRGNPSLATVLAALRALELRLDVTPAGPTHHVVRIADHVGATDSVAATVTPPTHATRAGFAVPAPVDLDAVLDAVREDGDLGTDEDAGIGRDDDPVDG